MKLLGDMVSDFEARFGHRWTVPEYRQIELYSKKKKLAFSDAATACNDTHIPGMLGTSLAFMLLESFLESRDASLLEGKVSWQKYLSLPRKTPVEKLVAEVYRILRIFRFSTLHTSGLLEMRDGLVRASCTFERYALSLNITPIGLALLESFVFYYLDSFRQPYSEAYVEAMLTQYFTDIVAEIRKFADEDRVLYQFRQAQAFNRHFRFDCDNPKYTMRDGYIFLDIGDTYRDPMRYPIDFFLIANDALHIVPVEALTNNSLPVTELGKWKSPHMELPAHFRARFGRETMVSGLPMT